MKCCIEKCSGSKLLAIGRHPRIQLQIVVLEEKIYAPYTSPVVPISSASEPKFREKTPTGRMHKFILSEWLLSTQDVPADSADLEEQIGMINEIKKCW